MILVRDVFQAKYGHGDDLIAIFKASPVFIPFPRRILTDASGTFFTIVIEYEAESIDAFQRALAESFSKPDFPVWFERMTPLVESGRREFYNILD